MKIVLFLMILLAFPQLSLCQTFTAKNDDEVLEELSEIPSLEERQNRALILSSNITPDFQQTIKQAKEYLLKGKKYADPRYYSYAETIIQPLFSLYPNEPELYIISSHVKQNRHDFQTALKDVEKTLAIDPHNIQAWILKSSIALVLGDTKTAKESCSKLVGSAEEFILATCLSAVASVSGESHKTKSALLREIAFNNPKNEELLLWAYAVLFELYFRLEEYEKMENILKLINQTKNDDSYILAIHTDYLIKTKQFEKVVEMLQEKQREDNLLLRLAIAAKNLNSPAASNYISKLQSIFEEANLRGNSPHKREEAIYFLRLINNPSKALELAKNNWDIQKEPIDVLVLAEAASINKDKNTLLELRNWMQTSKLEYPEVSDILSRDLSK